MLPARTTVQDQDTAGVRAVRAGCNGVPSSGMRSTSAGRARSALPTGSGSTSSSRMNRTSSPCRLGPPGGWRIFSAADRAIREMRVRSPGVAATYEQSASARAKRTPTTRGAVGRTITRGCHRRRPSRHRELHSRPEPDAGRAPREAGSRARQRVAEFLPDHEPLRRGCKPRRLHFGDTALRAVPSAPPEPHGRTRSAAPQILSASSWSSLGIASCTRASMIGCR